LKEEVHLAFLPRRFRRPDVIGWGWLVAGFARRFERPPSGPRTPFGGLHGPSPTGMTLADLVRHTFKKFDAFGAATVAAGALCKGRIRAPSGNLNFVSARTGGLW
jgi:hypothetical protein